MHLSQKKKTIEKHFSKNSTLAKKKLKNTSRNTATQQKNKKQKKNTTPKTAPQPKKKK